MPEDWDDERAFEEWHHDALEDSEAGGQALRNSYGVPILLLMLMVWADSLRGNGTGLVY